MKFDEEPDLALGLDAMKHLGDHDPEHGGLQDSLTRERSLDHVTQATGEHVDHAPHPGFRRMILPQRIRDRQLIELERPFVRCVTGGQLEPIAADARKFKTTSPGTSFGGQHPGSSPERWAVTNVLAVPASQLGHPIASLVLVKPFDRALHRH